jgi:hypothetical protein
MLSTSWLKLESRALGVLRPPEAQGARNELPFSLHPGNTFGQQSDALSVL